MVYTSTTRSWDNRLYAVPTKVAGGNQSPRHNAACSGPVLSCLHSIWKVVWSSSPQGPWCWGSLACCYPPTCSPWFCLSGRLKTLIITSRRALHLVSGQIKKRKFISLHAHSFTLHFSFSKAWSSLLPVNSPLHEHYQSKKICCDCRASCCNFWNTTHAHVLPRRRKPLSLVEVVRLVAE